MRRLGRSARGAAALRHAFMTRAAVARSCALAGLFIRANILERGRGRTLTNYSTRRPRAQFRRPDKIVIAFGKTRYGSRRAKGERRACRAATISTRAERSAGTRLHATQTRPRRRTSRPQPEAPARRPRPRERGRDAEDTRTIGSVISPMLATATCRVSISLRKNPTGLSVTPWPRFVISLMA
jgi:hypothetical protein